MLEVCKKNEDIRSNFKLNEEPKIEDIIVTRTKTEISYDKDGNEIRKRIDEKINLTKKINETKKLLNNYTAEEKIAEIEKIFTK